MDRELVNQVPEMSGLARRLRDEDLPMSREEVAKEVEQLERELAEWKLREGAVSNSYIDAMAELRDAHDDLAAEKALADTMYSIILDRVGLRIPNLESYRKARGL